MKRKKIAIITPFLAQGGLEKVAVTGAEELQKYYDVTLIVFDTFLIDYPYKGKVIDLKIPFYALNIVNRIFAIVKIGLRLRKLKKKENFDLMIVHGELANLPVIISGKGKHIVVIHATISSTIQNIPNKIFGLIRKQIYSHVYTKKIVTVSEGIRNSFLEKFHFNSNYIQTIYNPFEIIKIENMSIEPLTDFQDLFHHYEVLISVARLSEQKGYTYLLEVYKQLIKNNSNQKLLILGDGELRKSLIAFSKTLGLKTYSIFSDDRYDVDYYDVYFIGFQSNPFQYMARAKLFIMSSYWEGFGNTLVEAMASGTPVLSTDCQSGPKEIVSPNITKNIKELTYGQFGFLLPIFDRTNNQLSQNDKKIWLNGLSTILADTENLKKYQMIGQERANFFNVNCIMKEWKSLIDNTIDN